MGAKNPGPPGQASHPRGCNKQALQQPRKNTPSASPEVPDSTSQKVPTAKKDILSLPSRNTIANSGAEITTVTEFQKVTTNQKSTECTLHAGMSMAAQENSPSEVHELSMAAGVVTPTNLAAGQGTELDSVQHSGQLQELHEEISQLDIENSHLIEMLSEKNTLIAAIKTEKSALEHSLSESQGVAFDLASAKEEVERLSNQLLTEKSVLECERLAHESTKEETEILKKQAAGLTSQVCTEIATRQAQAKRIAQLEAELESLRSSLEQAVAEKKDLSALVDIIDKELVALSESVETLKTSKEEAENERREFEADASTAVMTMRQLKACQETTRTLTKERDAAVARAEEAEERRRAREEETDELINSIIANQERQRHDEEDERRRNSLAKVQPVLRLTNSPAPSHSEKKERKLCVVIVIDASGSMAGAPRSRLQGVVQALLTSLEAQVDGDVHVGFIYHGEFSRNTTLPLIFADTTSMTIATEKLLAMRPRILASLPSPYALPAVEGGSEQYSVALDAVEAMMEVHAYGKYQKIVVFIGDGGFAGHGGKEGEYGNRLRKICTSVHYIDVESDFVGQTEALYPSGPAAIARFAGGLASGWDKFNDRLGDMWQPK